MALPILTNVPPRPLIRRELPTVDALESLWREVVATPLWRPRRLWSYLQLRWRMRLGLIDPAAVRIVTPRGKINDCHSCTDSCCLGGRNTVLLRLRDIAQLIDIGRTELMTQDKPTFSSAMQTARPALRRQLQSYAWQSMPVLKQKPYGACFALDEAGRCSIYPFWPLSCSRFPMSLDVESEEIFYAERCRAYWIHPSEEPRAQAMAHSAVHSYNERVKDAILMTFARPQLARLGLSRYLRL